MMHSVCSGKTAHCVECGRQMYGRDFPMSRTIIADAWGLLETLESIGSVVTTLSVIGVTIVKGA